MAFSRRLFAKALVGAGSIPLAGMALDAMRGAGDDAPSAGDRSASAAGRADVTSDSPGEPRNQPAATPDRTYSLDARRAGEGGTPLDSTTQYLYNRRYPAPELRVPAGDTIQVAVENDLPKGTGTTVHWHGVPVPNEMDGVPGVTQDPIPSGESMTYAYEASPPGTYMYHSHVAQQMDRSLFGPLVVEEEEPRLDYDREVVVFVDDYLAATPPTEENPDIPLYDGIVVNGRLPDDPQEVGVTAGERVRFRFINGASAGVFDLRLAGHTLTVTHADGRPVDPVQVDSLRFGSAERYDAVVEFDNPGAWELAATPVNAGDLGDPERGRLVVDYEQSSASPQSPRGSPTRLDRSMLRAVERYGHVRGSPDREYGLTLSPGDDGAWLMGGQRYPDADPLSVSPGDHVRVTMRNESEMYHPMHLHGHFFKVGHAVRDTALVAPGQQVTFDVYADNPGEWFFHCHNQYHLASGMARVVSYDRQA